MAVVPPYYVRLCRVRAYWVAFLRSSRPSPGLRTPPRQPVEGVGGIAGMAGRGIEGLAGLVDAIAPLGVAMTGVSAAVALLIAGFDRARATGSAAFLALSSKGAATGLDFKSTAAGLYAQVYAATANQRLASGLSGVDMDKMTRLHWVRLPRQELLFLAAI